MVKLSTKNADVLRARRADAEQVFELTMEEARALPGLFGRFVPAAFEHVGFYTCTKLANGDDRTGVKTLYVLKGIDAPRCHFMNCKKTVTHTVQRLWTIRGRAPFAQQHCCDDHIPGIFDRESTFMRSLRRAGYAVSRYYRVERIK